MCLGGMHFSLSFFLLLMRKELRWCALFGPGYVLLFLTLHAYHILPYLQIWTSTHWWGRRLPLVHMSRAWNQIISKDFPRCLEISICCLNLIMLFLYEHDRFSSIPDRKSAEKHKNILKTCFFFPPSLEHICWCCKTWAHRSEDFLPW